VAGQAVHFGKELGLRQIVLEGDFRLVVDAVKTKGTNDI
jgi:hypothetical protein